MRQNWVRVVGMALAIALVTVACGDDDGADPTVAPSATEAEGMPVPGSAGAVDTVVEGESGEYSEVCAVAQEFWEQEDFPSHAQLERYIAAAPAEIKAAVDLAGGRLLDVPEGDLVSFFNVMADDDVEAALEAIDAFEEERCGIPHSEGGALVAAGTSHEIEPGAQRVDVTALDFTFEFDGTIAAGRTSFVLTNQGDQAHFLLVVKMADGVDLQAALESDDDSSFVGFWETGTAAPGGSDEEVVTFDLEPGDYAMLCWIPGADGLPHVFHGMAVPFTVS
jgi:uncharacterized cupredoxin-like copper-binding protein